MLSARFPLLFAVAAAAVIAFALPAASASAASCPAPTAPAGITPSTLTVSKATCAVGSSVATGFFTCKLAPGPTGRCVGKVAGYACQEIRTNLPTQLNGKVTCGRSKTVKKNGKKKTTKYRVNFTYTQTL